MAKLFDPMAKVATAWALMGRIQCDYVIYAKIGC